MGKVKLTPAVPASEEKTSRVKLTPAEDNGPSYSDKALGWAKAIVEKGGGSPRAIEDIAAENEGLTDTVLDTAFGAGQGLTYNLLDEGIGAAKAVLERGGGSKRPPEDIYREGRDAVRGSWAEARERSPVGTLVGEVGGAMVSPANRILSAGKGVRGIVRGAAEGGVMSYGATEKEDIKGQIGETATGAGIGAGVGAVSNFVGQRFNKSPDAMRAEVLGVKAKDYRVPGPGDRKKIVERIKETGLLKSRKMEYDVDQMKFVPKNKSKASLDEIEMNTEERLIERSNDAIAKLQDKKDKLFGPLMNSRFVPAGDIDVMVDEIAEEYGRRGIMKGPFDRQAMVLKIRENIYDQVMQMGGNMSRFSLSEIDKLKHMAQEDVRNFSKGLGELGDTDELARITSRKLKEILEKNIGDPVFQQINGAQHDFLSIRSDLTNKLKSLELAAPSHQHLEKTNFIEGALKDAFGGSQGRLDAASWKESYQNIVPDPVRALVPYATQEVPGAIYRQKVQGKENMKGNFRNPGSVPNIPEELIRTPLPRTTDGLMKNKKFVLAKVAQMAPEMFEAVQDTYDRDPEMLSEIAPVLAQKMPHFFERDKYNRFDGRIMNEADKQKAIKDTLLRKDIGSIEQAKIITKLNKEGLYDQ
jgi:hypothetical protein